MSPPTTLDELDELDKLDKLDDAAALAALEFENNVVNVGRWRGSEKPCHDSEATIALPC